MGIDEARHADHAVAGDHLRLRGIDLGGDRDNGTVAHVHVTARKIGNLGVHREHVGAADDEFATRRQLRDRALHGPRRRLGENLR